jgi:hypothetical protein
MNDAGRYFLYACEYVIVRFERSILMIVMTNVHSQCILMEITIVFINFTREANQKSGKSLAWNSHNTFSFHPQVQQRFIRYKLTYRKASIQIDTRIIAYIQT